jgi:hypothetical protein
MEKRSPYRNRAVIVTADGDAVALSVRVLASRAEGIRWRAAIGAARRTVVLLICYYK